MKRKYIHFSYVQTRIETRLSEKEDDGIPRVAELCRHHDTAVSPIYVCNEVVSSVLFQLVQKWDKIEPGTTLAVSRKVIWNAVYTKITAMKKIGEELV